MNAPVYDLETRNAKGLEFLESVRRLQDPSSADHKHHVGGAASGALRDIQRMQNNPEYRINHGDWAVIRNERVPGEKEFHPFQVLKILEVVVDPDDVIERLTVHECGGDKPKGAEGPCDWRQTYKPRYKGTDPLDGLEKDIFYERVHTTGWHKPVYASIDPLSVVEWGKIEMMTTTQRRLKHKVLEVISHQPRVEWKLPEKEQKAVENKADSANRRAASAQKKPAGIKKMAAAVGNKRAPASKKKKADASQNNGAKEAQRPKKRKATHVVQGPAKRGRK